METMNRVDMGGYPACPNCGEVCEVEGGHVEIDDFHAWQDVTCLKCGCEYTEIYEYCFTEIREKAVR